MSYQFSIYCVRNWSTLYSPRPPKRVDFKAFQRLFSQYLSHLGNLAKPETCTDLLHPTRSQADSVLLFLSVNGWFCSFLIIFTFCQELEWMNAELKGTSYLLPRKLCGGEQDTHLDICLRRLNVKVLCKNVWEDHWEPKNQDLPQECRDDLTLDYLRKSTVIYLIHKLKQRNRHDHIKTTLRW